MPHAVHPGSVKLGNGLHRRGGMFLRGAEVLKTKAFSRASRQELLSETLKLEETSLFQANKLFLETLEAFAALSPCFHGCCISFPCSCRDVLMKPFTCCNERLPIATGSQLLVDQSSQRAKRMSKYDSMRNMLGLKHVETTIRRATPCMDLTRNNASAQRLSITI